MVIESERRGWVAASVSCLSGMQEDVIQQAQRRGSEFLAPKDDRRLTGLSIGQAVSLDWTLPKPPQENWRSRLSSLLDELEENDVGLLMLVDEIDPDLDEMAQLAAVYQQLVGEERKIALFMAGLPHRISRLLTNKSVSFLRRAAQRKLPPLSSDEVGIAFKSTVAQGGKEISDAALADAVNAINGFPYMMQLVGYRAWQAAIDKTAVEEGAVTAGVRMAEEDMRTRVLQATLDELSASDLEFLKAMLEDEENSKPEDIQYRLDRSSAHVSVYRKRLLEQGVITDLGRKRFEFALPGLRDFLPGYLENNL